MPLSTLFKRKPASGAAPPAAPLAGDEPPLVAAARVRARRRLIGAVVLLGVGIIGFPLLFETAPRPIPVDIPIEIPRKDGVAPLAMPPATSPSTAPTTAPRTAASGAVPPVATITLPPDAGSELPAAAAAEPAPASAAVASALRAPASAPSAAAKASAAAAVKPSGDGQRARALLDGSAPAAAPAASGADDKAVPRFVVQVGAYTDPTALREARQKVEKLGLKTYTQVVETEAGKRTRVRIGPFASRDEADAAVRTLKTAGLPGNILAL